MRKEKMLKPCLAMVLTFCMVLGIFASPLGVNTVWAAGDECAIGSNTFATLDAALVAVNSGETITLLQDINYTKGLTITNGVILDAGNYNLNIDNPAALGIGLQVINGGKVVISGSGSINVKATYKGLKVNDTGSSAVVSSVTNTDVLDNSYCVCAYNGGRAEVLGDVNSKRFGVVVSDSGSYAKVNGNVIMDLNAEGHGASAQYRGVIDITGDVTGGLGLSALYSSKITVDGKVTATTLHANGATALYSSEITIGEGVSGVDRGAFANGDGCKITILKGDATAAGPNSDCYGACAYFGAVIDIQEGDAEGTIAGVYAEDSENGHPSTINIHGDVRGASGAIATRNNANIHVYGNAVGDLVHAVKALNRASITVDHDVIYHGVSEAVTAEETSASVTVLGNVICDGAGVTAVNVIKGGSVTVEKSIAEGSGGTYILIGSTTNGTAKSKEDVTTPSDKSGYDLYSDASADTKDGSVSPSKTYVKSTAPAAPSISTLAAIPASLSSSGGSSAITVNGSGLNNGILVAAFDSAVQTAISGTTSGTATAQTVTLTGFPANASTSVDNVYTIKASLDGGATWNTANTAVTVVQSTPVVVPPTGSGSSGGGGGGSSSSSTPQPKPSAEMLASSGNVIESITPKLNNNTGIATIEADPASLTIAFDKSKADEEGVKTVTVDIPKIDGAIAYEPVLPASFLTSGDATKAVEIKTNIAAVTVPGSMLTAANAGAQNASLSIAAGDKSKLAADIQTQIGSRPIIELSLKIDGQKVSWSNESAPVTVSIPYKPTADELKDPEHITVWYIDSSGNAVSVPSGRYDPATGCVSFSTTHFSKYAVTSVYKTFDDLGRVTWAKKQIETLASKGIVRGLSEKEYAPSTNITRADFLYSLVRTLGIDAKVDGNFKDISSSAYYYKEIGIAKKLGITTGSGNNKFNPDAGITRQDMMVLTERALRMQKKLEQQGTASDLVKFADKSLVAAYAVDSIASVVKEGLIVGSGDKVNPRGNTTRAEAAVFLYRIYNKY